MAKILIKQAKIVNEGQIIESDLLINEEFIEKIAPSISAQPDYQIIESEGQYLFPGLIDDQVHFREPGLTHKAEIYTESRAAVAGGVTSFMEMPNTVPNTLTQDLLADKYAIGAAKSLANYSFFMGASNDNLEEVLKTDPKNVCGVKIFMGSSTGNMLVDNESTLSGLFSNVDMLIATHCEDEATIRKNTALFKEKYGEDVPIECHPLIRNEEACYLSSSMAVDLAKKHGTKLHILHISTAKELSLFENTIPLAEKRITAEACIHHLWFNDTAYKEKGSLVKWNPAIKTAADQQAIMEAVNNNVIDVIATDHAPHTIEEKTNSYFKAPSGGPLVQHSLLALLEMEKMGKISLEKIAEKTAHHVAILFQIEKRGFIREGYYADLVLVDRNKSQTVSKSNILAKCGWSPFEGTSFHANITHTFVSGHLAFAHGKLNDSKLGKRLVFER